ncbi:DNA-pol [Cyclophragma undans nucleopolyhedrovirus]|uniref:DNA polymerase n=1 Tax=Cyclophragma undans nucleopolyhedrovirus TaxID=1906244 RepID=A0A288QYQ9_9ABAC|nr:DNA-pol [Cyclophragma undans nucleopolyhedrovirus]AOT85544.1 DNA-pol [Cyclophragma undans nucleopolyhedrovirus]
MRVYTTYDEIKKLLIGYCKPGVYTLTSEHIFRIIRLMYDEDKGCLLVFCNTKIDSAAAAPHSILQFYFRVKLDLYSYKQCYDNHIFSTCRNRCASYVTFVAPGLRGVHLNKINVIKYKRNGASRSDNANCLDKFLHNVNRVHMQTPFVEGKYMRFKAKQRCENNCVQMTHRTFNIDTFETDFEAVDEMTLTAGIMPVLSCYDIETHSDGHNMSKASVDFIISIALAVFKDGNYSRFCFMYDKHAIASSVTGGGGGVGFDDDTTNVVLFADETSMITAFLDLIKLTNPDIILDYNGDMFDLPFIIGRMKRNKLQLKRYDLPAAAPVTKLFINKLGNKVDTYYFNYYVHIDLYKYFSTDSNQSKVENFQLNTISDFYLGENKIDLHWTDMIKMYNRGDGEQLLKIAKYNVQDCMLPIKLFLKLKIIDSMYSQCILHRLCTDDVICNISHLISVAYFYKSITNTRLNATTNRQEPDPYFFNKNDLSIISGQQFKKSCIENGRGGGGGGGIARLNRKRIPLNCIPETAVNLGPCDRTIKYKGGKVLQPRAGIYKYAFSLDFNSLYLTIMIMTCACLSNLILCDNGNVYLNRDESAINVKLLSELLKQRCKFKKNRDDQSESEFLYDLYDQMQNSVKRTANSIYGYFGIFFKILANYITKVGRDQLRTAIALIEALSNDADILKEFCLQYINFKVIYGDTDSTFVLPTFNYENIPEEDRLDKLKKICGFVERRVNAAFGGGGYKMAFENLMCVLILLKKKKYCYLNSDNKITYKGWLVKKDMPVFMRIAFRSAVEQILRHLDIDLCLQTLTNTFKLYYEEFGGSKPLTDYSFSMTYNDNPGKKRTSADDASGPSTPKRRIVTIARHCREILVNKGTDFVPGNGDRIPYLLVDVQGKVTEKAFPLRLFDPAKMRISWIKHMGILCTFMNELLEIFGDEHCEKIDGCFKSIMDMYMRNQCYDRKRPVLVKIGTKTPPIGLKRKLEKNTEDDNEDGDCDEDADTSEDENNVETVVSNNSFKFCLHKI